MKWVMEPLQFEFMRGALLAGLFIGAAAASLGVYVVLRRMAFIGDALAHASLPGLAAAYMAGVSMIAGALLAAVLTSVGIGFITRGKRISEDTSIGVLFTAMFALGILLLSQVKSYRCLSHVIFGNILGVTGADLIATLILACGVLAALIAFHKELELTTCDPGYAQTIGLDPGLIRYLLLVLLALTVVCGIQSAGVILTSALLVTPAAAASLLTSSVPRMLVISNIIASAATVCGLYISFYAGISAGACIVLLCSICFGMAWMLRRHLDSTPVLLKNKEELRHV
jgi:ABC-type Mn2+/Zn2+ transport system permease subunit